MGFPLQARFVQTHLSDNARKAFKQAVLEQGTESLRVSFMHCI